MALTVISGGQVVTPDGVLDADVVVDGERIVAIAQPGRFAGETIDARGCVVLPGGVDPHVHILSDVPAADQALLGGTTTALSFTLPQDGESPAQTFDRARDAQLPHTSLDVGLHAALWSPDAVTAADVDALAQRGVCGLKLFVAYPELGMMASDAVVYRVMSWARTHDLPTQIHCENGDLIDQLVSDALAAGRTSVHAFFETRPPVAEEEAVHRMLRLAQFARARVYLVHLTTAGALDDVRAARRRSTAVTAEACTGGLMLDDSASAAADPRRFMAAPPPRARADVEAVWEAVADGTLDALGSDHTERREGWVGTESPQFTEIPYGLRGIRVRLPLLLGEGLRRGVPVERMAALLATGPARAFGIASKGTLAPGADADVVIWDPDGSWTIGEDYPAWRGITVPGAVRTVLRRGERVVDDGALSPSRTPGRHLRPGANGES